MNPSDYAECDGTSRLSPFYVKESAEWTIEDVDRLGDFNMLDIYKDESPNAISTAYLYIIQVPDHEFLLIHKFLLIHDSLAFQTSDRCQAEERKREILANCMEDSVEPPDVNDKIAVLFSGRFKKGRIIDKDVGGKIGVYTVQYKEFKITDTLKNPWKYLNKVEETRTRPVQINTGRKRVSPYFYQPARKEMKMKNSQSTMETMVLDDSDDSDDEEKNAHKRIRKIAQQISALFNRA